MKIGMSRRGVDGELGTEGTCPFVSGVDGGALGFVAQLMGGGVDVAVTIRSDDVFGGLGDKSA
jgi:hypothetical protein